MRRALLRGATLRYNVGVVLPLVFVVFAVAAAPPCPQLDASTLSAAQQPRLSDAAGVLLLRLGAIVTLLSSSGASIAGGTLIHADGYVVTAAAPLTNAAAVRVKIGREVLPADILLVDLDADIALVKFHVSSSNVEGFGPLPGVTGPPDALLGESVVALFAGGERVEVGMLTQRRDDGWDTSLNAPTDGVGAGVFDACGGLLGLVTRVQGGRATVRDRSAVQRALAGSGELTRVGLALDWHDAQRAGIAVVVDDSIAARSGLSIEMALVAIDGHAIDDAFDVVAALWSQAPAAAAVVRVRLPEGTTDQITLPAQPAAPRFIDVVPLSAATAVRFSLSGHCGVQIAALDERAPGLKVGDVVLRVNATEIHDVATFTAAFEKRPVATLWVAQLAPVGRVKPVVIRRAAKK